jgi:hypothetical protein
MKNLEKVRWASLADSLPVQKLQNFLLTDFRGFFCFIYVDSRILSHSASNFLIKQTRSPLHYISSCSDFGFELPEIFIIEKQLADSVSWRVRYKMFKAISPHQ